MKPIKEYMQELKNLQFQMKNVGKTEEEKKKAANSEYIDELFSQFGGGNPFNPKF